MKPSDASLDRESIAEKIFIATINDASEGVTEDADYSGLAFFWAKRCLLMADGFIAAIDADREARK